MKMMSFGEPPSTNGDTVGRSLIAWNNTLFGCFMSTFNLAPRENMTLRLIYHLTNLILQLYWKVVNKRNSSTKNLFSLYNWHDRLLPLVVNNWRLQCCEFWLTSFEHLNKTTKQTQKRGPENKESLSSLDFQVTLTWKICVFLLGSCYV